MGREKFKTAVHEIIFGCDHPEEREYGCVPCAMRTLLDSNPQAIHAIRALSAPRPEGSET